jgi:ubiquinone biosynthesis protein COQ4
MLLTFPQRLKPSPDRFFARIDRLGALANLNVAPLFNPSDLQALPPDTMGRSLIDFLAHNQIQPLLTGPRRKQLHDVIHVVTGYGTDRTGELEVQLFLWGATRVPIHLILSAGLLVLESPTELSRPDLSRPDLSHPDLSHPDPSRRDPSPQNLVQRLQLAHQRGTTSTLHPDRWQPETQWHLPLSQVRQSLGIVPL